METHEISAHQVRVYEFAAKHGGWVTSKELAQGANVAPRTARAHALRFVQLGIFDQADMFPGHRYRLSALADKRNRMMLQRLTEVGAILGGNAT